MDSHRIVHHDRRLVVLDKPSGLLSVPGRGPQLQDCLARRVQEQFPSALVVHRLDRDTSGLIVMALDPDAQRHLARQFEVRSARKRYECLVWGRPDYDDGLVDLPIARDLDRPPRYRIDHAHGRPSHTRWRVLTRLADRSRLDIEPITGRSHQIRLHLATLGHPVLGDPLYAHPAALDLAPRLLLHATALTLAHPDDEQPVAWRSPCPF